MERVSWDDVQAFIRKLNARSGGSRYRLPTEAEWEYAVRAGTTSDTYAGDVTESGGEDPVLNRIAWYDENSGGRTHPVGAEGAQRVGAARHAGERAGVGGGLVRGLSWRESNRPCGPSFRLGPGLSGRQLAQPRWVLPVGASRQGLAGLPPQPPRLPPAEDGITLGALTLLPLAAPSARGRAGRREAGRGSAPAERRSARLLALLRVELLRGVSRELCGVAR